MRHGGIGHDRRGDHPLAFADTAESKLYASQQEIEAAKAPVRQQIAFYASTPAYSKVLELHGWGDVGRRLTELSKRGAWMEMGAEITDEMLDVYATTGTHDQIVDTLKRKYAGYLDRLAFYFPFHRSDEALWRSLASAFNGSEP